jgi:hypothetical protein
MDSQSVTWRLLNILLLTAVKSVFIRNLRFCSQENAIVMSVQTVYLFLMSLTKSVLESDKTAPTQRVHSVPFQNMTEMDIGPFS